MSGLDLTIEVAGWAGAVLILVAYLLLSAGKLTGQSLVYQGMNVVGAAGFIANGWWHGALPSAALNVLWLLIGAVASWRILKKRGSSFQIGRIDMIANTGTYLDAPSHRYEDGPDLAGITLEQMAALPGLVVRQPWENGLAVGLDRFEGKDVAGKAVLVHTGWDRHWRTDAYFDDHPFLTAEAAGWLADQGARLVGIDSHNIDDTRTKGRPVHSTLLGAGVLICEHMTNLGALPDQGFAFTAAPPKIEGTGTFPVRAFALLS